MWVLEIDVLLLEELLLEDELEEELFLEDELLLEDGFDEDGLELVLPLGVVELISLFLDGLDSTVV